MDLTGLQKEKKTGTSAKNEAGRFLRLPRDEAIFLDSGERLYGVTIAYQTYGELNPARDNAILVCHALTGDQFAAGIHPVTGRPGWWSKLIGPGRTLDSDRYFIICSNVLGGCMGTTGPSTINEATGRYWGLTFPVITIGDMVRLQVRLLDHLGIERLFCAIGGSMGAMQVLQLAANYPERVAAAAAIAGAARHTSQNIAFHEVGRQAIVADPEWRGGEYLEAGTRPRRGLAVARMEAHITYLSEAALQQKFGRNLQDRTAVTYGFDADFQVESYLRHQGGNFVERFDANSYLYITRAMDYFDLSAGHRGALAEAFRGTRTRFCLVSFSSDWLFPTRESRVVAQALNALAADVSFVEIDSDNGHDSFLLEEPEFFLAVQGFLDGCARKAEQLTSRSSSADHQAPSPPPSPPLSAKFASPRLHAAQRLDLELVAGMITPGSRVLDVGCADGLLLEYLARVRNVDARGLELDQKRVNHAAARGLAVIQGNADTDLAAYPDQAFDFVVLTLTLQSARSPNLVLRELLRIGSRAIVSFANLGALKHRLALGLGGRAPLVGSDDDAWHVSDNIHPCTIRDFLALCASLSIRIEQALVLGPTGRGRKMWSLSLANLFSEQALFVLTKGNGCNRDERNKDERNKDERNKDERNKDERNKDERNKDERNRDGRNKDERKVRDPGGDLS